MVFLQLCTILIFKVKVNKYKKKKSSLPESLLAGQLKEKKKRVKFTRKFRGAKSLLFYV